MLNKINDDDDDDNVVVITETHFKQKHSDSVIAVPDYSAFRKDRVGRKGGGVAIYVRSSLQSLVWSYAPDDGTYELLWVRVNTAIIGALYHPPRPQYVSSSMIDYIEANVEEIVCTFPDQLVILAGDFNQLPVNVIEERTVLTSLVQQPTAAPTYWIKFLFPGRSTTKYMLSHLLSAATTRPSLCMQIQLQLRL